MHQYDWSFRPPFISLSFHDTEKQYESWGKVEIKIHRKVLLFWFSFLGKIFQIVVVSKIDPTQKNPRSSSKNIRKLFLSEYQCRSETSEPVWEFDDLRSYIFFYRITSAGWSSCYLLMTAWSSANRKTRGRSLPGCGSGVTEPTSTKPKPTRCKPCIASPSLSKPAAVPTGLLKRRPHTSTAWDADEEKNEQTSMNNRRRHAHNIGYSCLTNNLNASMITMFSFVFLLRKFSSSFLQYLC